MSIFGEDSLTFFKSTWVYQYCRAVELTPRIARKLKTNTNYFILAGQWYFSDNDKPNSTDFLSSIQIFSFDKYTPNNEEPFGTPNDNNQYIYGVKLPIDQKWYFGTGSGLDPVYIITRFTNVQPPPNMNGVLFHRKSSKITQSKQSEIMPTSDNLWGEDTVEYKRIQKDTSEYGATEFCPIL